MLSTTREKERFVFTVKQKSLTKRPYSKDVQMPSRNFEEINMISTMTFTSTILSRNFQSENKLSLTLDLVNFTSRVFKRGVWGEPSAIRIKWQKNILVSGVARKFCCHGDPDAELRSRWPTVAFWARSCLSLPSLLPHPSCSWEHKRNY